MAEGSLLRHGAQRSSKKQQRVQHSHRAGAAIVRTRLWLAAPAPEGIT